MSTIIAGRFNIQPQVQSAIAALQSAGFAPERISSFYVNPAGQHDLYRFGGDHDKSPGAELTDRGAIAGMAAGAAVGLAVTPVIGPVGPILGAYVGSLMGGLVATKEFDEMNPLTEMQSEHHSGMLVAVATDALEQSERAAQVLQAAGGFELETAQGRIEEGDWIDFDPREAPHLLDPAPQASR